MSTATATKVSLKSFNGNSSSSSTSASSSSSSSSSLRRSNSSFSTSSSSTSASSSSSSLRRSNSSFSTSSSSSSYSSLSSSRPTRRRQSEPISKKRRKDSSSSSTDDEEQEPQWLQQLRDSQRRRSRRTNTSSSLQDLARILVNANSRKRSSTKTSTKTSPTKTCSDNPSILFITGAGLSASSGIRPFRGPKGIWSQVIWKKSTREEFRKDPLEWYNDFWLKYFPPHTYGEYFEPNEGHEAIAQLVNLCEGAGVDVRVITQNVDGLHSRTSTNWDWEDKLIEAHGRLGLYKCIPESDSDTDSESDEEEDRKVKLGSRKKSRALRRAYRRGTGTKILEKKSAETHQLQDDLQQVNDAKRTVMECERVPCKYEMEESIPVNLIRPASVSSILSGLDPPDAMSSSDESQDSSSNRSSSSNTITSQTSSSSAGDDSSQKSGNDQPKHKSRKKNKSRNKSRHSTCDIYSTADSVSRSFLEQPPHCPSCQRPCPPQALLFDEGYHSHSHYQFERMENWMECASTIIFVGTSFAVSLTNCALEHARDEDKAVYNFNIDGGALESTAWMNVENIIGDVQRTLPALLKACEEELING